MVVPMRGCLELRMRILNSVGSGLFLTTTSSLEGLSGNQGMMAKILLSRRVSTSCQRRIIPFKGEKSKDSGSAVREMSAN